MYKLLPILLFAYGLAVTTDSIRVQSGDIMVDFRNLDYNEKVDTLIYIKKKSNEIIIHSAYYNLRVQNIISIEIYANWVRKEELERWI